MLVMGALMRIDAFKKLQCVSSLQGGAREALVSLGHLHLLQDWQEAGCAFGEQPAQGTPVDIYHILAVHHLLDILVLLEEIIASPKLKPENSIPQASLQLPIRHK